MYTKLHNLCRDFVACSIIGGILSNSWGEGGGNIAGIWWRTRSACAMTRRCAMAPVAARRAPLDAEVACTGLGRAEPCSTDQTRTSLTMERHLEAPAPFPFTEDIAIDHHHTDDEEAASGPNGCTLEGCARLTGLALAVAKSPAHLREMVAMTMASA